MDNKSYFDLTASEIKGRAALTPKEKEAVKALMSAARSLPKSLCLKVEDGWDDGVTLTILKRITKGSAHNVAKLRKKSLCF